MSDRQFNTLTAAKRADQCARRLKGHVDADASISLTTLCHGDGGYTSKAFHTCWSDPDRTGFAREVVYYQSLEDEFVHAVEYYFSGHHEEHFEYVLGD